LWPLCGEAKPFTPCRAGDSFVFAFTAAYAGLEAGRAVSTSSGNTPGQYNNEVLK